MIADTAGALGNCLVAGVEACLVARLLGTRTGAEAAPTAHAAAAPALDAGVLGLRDLTWRRRSAREADAEGATMGGAFATANVGTLARCFSPTEKASSHIICA